MPERTTFFRLLKEADKAAVLAEEVRAVREGRESGRRFEVDPRSFGQVPTSPFAYWVSERVRRLFRELPPFEGEGRTVKQGLATADDFRFVRCWWEVPPERILDGQHGPDWREDLEAFQAWCRRRTFEGKRWVPFAKGGEYSPYYADLHLVVNWENDGAEIRNFIDPRTGRTASRPQNTAYYFRPGLTYILRAAHFCPQPLPGGSIISVRGSGIFLKERFFWWLGLLSSRPFDALLKLMLGREGHPQFDMGDINVTPVPIVMPPKLETLANRASATAKQEKTIDEVEHVFSLPMLARAARPRFPERLATFAQTLTESGAKLRAFQKEIDDLAFDAYGFTEEDKRTVLEEVPQPELVDTTVDPRALAADLVSYCVGVVMGRWDVRYATGEREVPELPDPFDPLPVCPPGMLQGEDGLPLREAPPGYPIEIDSDGILVDREGHPDDIVARVREVLGLLFGERAEAIEAELVELLGVPGLRAYFARTGDGGFWQDHVKRYSASRRTAPIYWLLASPGGDVRFWVYAHRFDRDTLPKILGPRYLGGMIEGVRQELARLKPGGVVPPNLDRREMNRLAGLEDRLAELEEMARIIRGILERTNDRGEVVGYVPFLDDGVVLAAAPLHALIPWPKRERHAGRRMSELEKRWLELEAGKYDWARTAMLYWPSRVEARCREDRSIAIAHGREDLYEGDR